MAAPKVKRGKQVKRRPQDDDAEDARDAGDDDAADD